MPTLTSSAPAPAPTRWTLDARHAHVTFAVRHLMISTVRGEFTDVTATVSADGDDFESAVVEATIRAASIDTREPQRDAHLRSADFLDVERFPTIAFRSTRVVKAGDGRYRLSGDITIHGVTKTVALDVATEGRGRDPWGGERAGFSLTGVINRRDFGLTWNQALEAGGVLVGDDVRIAIDVELLRS